MSYPSFDVRPSPPAKTDPEELAFARPLRLPLRNRALLWVRARAMPWVRARRRRILLAAALGLAALAIANGGLIAGEVALFSDRTEMPLLLDANDLSHAGRRLLPRSMSAVSAAAYYPRHDLLVTVAPNGFVSMYRRSGASLAVTWTWRPPSKIVEDLEVVFTNMPGMLYVEGRNAKQASEYHEKETAQIVELVSYYRVTLGPHAWFFHGVRYEEDGAREVWQIMPGVFRRTLLGLRLYPREKPPVVLRTGGYFVGSRWNPSQQDVYWHKNWFVAKSWGGWSVHRHDGTLLRAFRWNHSRESFPSVHNDRLLLIAPHHAYDSNPERLLMSLETGSLDPVTLPLISQ